MLAAVPIVLGLGLVFEPQGVTTAAWITAGVELNSESDAVATRSVR